MAKKSIVRRIDRHLARRLREARREVGMSTRTVASKLPAALRVSHATIASYEKGTSVPPLDVLGALAILYERPLNWFLDNRKTISEFQFRNIESRVPLSEKRQFSAQAAKWAEAYMVLEKHLAQERKSRKQSVCDLSASQLADEIRTRHLNLDDGQPVVDTVALLESFSAWAIEVRPKFKVDGASARYNNRTVVVVNPQVSNERIRLNAAFELGLILYSGETKSLVTEIDNNAYDFAVSLLLPDSQVIEAFQSRSFLKLINYKERFGVSIAAMLHRAEKLGAINTSASRWLRSEMRKKGWRNQEPGYVWKDRAIRFEMLLEEAIYGKKLTWDDAERITSIPQSLLKERIISVYERGAEKEVDETEEPRVLKIFG